jgi:hypothetical protein
MDRRIGAWLRAGPVPSLLTDQHTLEP